MCCRCSAVTSACSGVISPPGSPRGSRPAGPGRVAGSCRRLPDPHRWITAARAVAGTAATGSQATPCNTPPRDPPDLGPGPPSPSTARNSPAANPRSHRKIRDSPAPTILLNPGTNHPDGASNSQVPLRALLLIMFTRSHRGCQSASPRFSPRSGTAGPASVQDLGFAVTPARAAAGTSPAGSPGAAAAELPQRGVPAAAAGTRLPVRSARTGPARWPWPHYPALARQLGLAADGSGVQARADRVGQPSRPGEDTIAW